MILLISLKSYNSKQRRFIKFKVQPWKKKSPWVFTHFLGRALHFFPEGQAFPLYIFLVCKNFFCNVVDFLLFQVFYDSMILSCCAGTDLFSLCHYVPIFSAFKMGGRGLFGFWVGFFSSLLRHCLEALGRLSIITMITTYSGKAQLPFYLR